MSQLLLYSDFILEGLLKDSETFYALWKTLENSSNRGFVTQVTLEVVYDELLKAFPPDVAEAFAESTILDLQEQLESCSVDSLSSEIVNLPNLKNPEARAALLCAKYMNFDIIVTQNPQNFLEAKFPILSGEELLERQHLEQLIHADANEGQFRANRSSLERTFQNNSDLSASNLDDIDRGSHVNDDTLISSLNNVVSYLGNSDIIGILDGNEFLGKGGSNVLLGSDAGNDPFLGGDGNNYLVGEIDDELLSDSSSNNTPIDDGVNDVAFLDQLQSPDIFQLHRNDYTFGVNSIGLSNSSNFNQLPFTPSIDDNLGGNLFGIEKSNDGFTII